MSQTEAKLLQVSRKKGLVSRQSNEDASNSLGNRNIRKHPFKHLIWSRSGGIIRGN